MIKFNIKIFSIATLITIVGLTLILCFVQPKMHKTFQMNIIEYLIKFNSDGSVSTTQTTTTTVVKDK